MNVVLAFASVDGQDAAARLTALHPLVDVVSGNTDGLHAKSFERANLGSSKIASALEGEKQAFAACR